MASATRLQSSMTRMLDSFERESVQWLQQVEIEFRASNRQFDENFRQMFVQTSNDRLNATYSKFILESQLNGLATNLSTPTGNLSNNRWSVWTRVEASPLKAELQNESIMLDDHDDDNDDAVTVAADAVNGINNGADDSENNAFVPTSDLAKDNPYPNVVDMDQSLIETKPSIQKIVKRLALKRQSKNGKGNEQIQRKKRCQQKPKKRAATFKCDKCDYASPSRWRINRHGAAHSAEKLFSCGHCELKYKYRDNLKNHMSKQHNVILL